jgi:hypothetical protein
MKKPDTFFRKPYGMKNDYGPVGGGNRKNAPSFIYEILHGEAKFIRGRTIEHRQKIWNGNSIDAHIPTDALEKLSRMEEIELRSSCEGSGPERPTYLIFRFKDPIDIKKTETFVKAMNVFEDVKSGFGVGNRGLLRIGVTTSLWYEKNPDEFHQWWRTLPLKFAIVLAVIQILGQEI